MADILVDGDHGSEFDRLIEVSWVHYLWIVS